MFWIPFPSKKPTPSEYQVIVFVLGVLLFGVGVAGVIAGVLAPSDKQVIANLAIRYGAGGIVLGLICFIGLWLMRRFGD